MTMPQHSTTETREANAESCPSLFTQWVPKRPHSRSEQISIRAQTMGQGWGVAQAFSTARIGRAWQTENEQTWMETEWIGRRRQPIRHETERQTPVKSEHRLRGRLNWGGERRVERVRFCSGGRYQDVRRAA